jgi:hypothetical protein
VLAIRFESVGDAGQAVLYNDGKRISSEYEDILAHYQALSKSPLGLTFGSIVLRVSVIRLRTSKVGTYLKLQGLAGLPEGPLCLIFLCTLIGTVIRTICREYQFPPALGRKHRGCVTCPFDCVLVLAQNQKNSQIR